MAMMSPCDYCRADLLGGDPHRAWCGYLQPPLTVDEIVGIAAPATTVIIDESPTNPEISEALLAQAAGVLVPPSQRVVTVLVLKIK